MYSALGSLCLKCCMFDLMYQTKLIKAQSYMIPYGWLQTLSSNRFVVYTARYFQRLIMIRVPSTHMIKKRWTYSRNGRSDELQATALQAVQNDTARH